MKRAIRLFLTFVVALAAYALAEYQAVHWVVEHPLPEITDIQIAFGDVPSTPYRDSAYWSPAFLDEVRVSFQDWIWHGNDNYMTRSDMAGKWINFRDGIRVTRGQSKDATRTIWMIGNSALIGHELPDQYTIPSQLQALVGTQANVVNLGMAGANTSQALARLHSLDLHKGDIVLLMSGAPESTDIFFEADRQRGAKLSDGLCNLIYWRTKSFVVQWACHDTMLQTPPGLLDERLQAYTAESLEFYTRTVTQIAAYTHDKDVTFVNILQPHPYRESLSPDDVINIGHRAGVEIAFRSFYASVPAKLVTLNLADVVPSTYFFNSAHVNEHGTALIAKAIYDMAIMPLQRRELGQSEF
ncbi:MAG: hypothetical protein ABI947_14165 [Chloroflexota bacterium]